MKFFSCFSGIEAASVALMPLGFECVGVAEVDKAASKVLAFHYPETPNLGDVLADDFIDRVKALSPDILVGGPPCQDFSIAGLRAGLSGNRGNLTLRWVEIIRAVGPLAALTENVPGWLSVNGGHAFGAFLGALVGSDAALIPPQECGGRWTDAGMVDGPEGRAAWRTLDAQFFGLAQRRKRVFVVFCPRNGADPSEILFERTRGGRDLAPSRKAREGIAPTLSARTKGGGGLGTDFDCDGGLIPQAFGGGNTSGPIDAAACLTAKGQRIDFEVETFIAHSLRGEGFDASEDGTGRGTPIVPVAYAIQERAVSENPNAGPQGSGIQEGIAYTLEDRHHVQAVAFSCKDHGADATEDLSPTLRAMGHSESHANAGGQLAVAFELRGREGGAQFEGPHDTANIRAASGGSSRSYVMAPEIAGTMKACKDSGGFSNSADHAAAGYMIPELQSQWAVRRLLPVECSRLQGFPDAYLDCVPADGPKYKMLGNSWAVPVVSWIGRRLLSAMEAA